jgi:hypothetical protein
MTRRFPSPCSNLLAKISAFAQPAVKPFMLIDVPKSELFPLFTLQRRRILHFESDRFLKESALLNSLGNFLHFLLFSSIVHLVLREEASLATVLLQL